MAKNCQNSRFGGKSRHICANLAIFSLFTGVTSLLITFSNFGDEKIGALLDQKRLVNIRIKLDQKCNGF